MCIPSPAGSRGARISTSVDTSRAVLDTGTPCTCWSPSSLRVGCRQGMAQAGRGYLVCWGRGEHQLCPGQACVRRTLLISMYWAWSCLWGVLRGRAVCLCCLPCLHLGVRGWGCGCLLHVWALLSLFAPYRDPPHCTCASPLAFWGAPSNHRGALGLPGPGPAGGAGRCALSPLPFFRAMGERGGKAHPS